MKFNLKFHGNFKSETQNTKLPKNYYKLATKKVGFKGKFISSLDHELDHVGRFSL